MLETIKKIPFADWVKKELARRLSYIPDEKTAALRYTCDTILKTDLPAWSESHNLILREGNRRIKPGEKRDLFARLYEEGLEREIRYRQSDPYFYSLQKTFEGIMAWAQPRYFVYMGEINIAGGDTRPLQKFDQRYDEWSEGAMLKVDYTLKEYLAARFPIMHANETNEIPAYNGMAAEKWVFNYPDPQRFRDEIEHSWKPWEYEGYPGKSHGSTH